MENDVDEGRDELDQDGDSRFGRSFKVVGRRKLKGCKEGIEYILAKGAAKAIEDLGDEMRRGTAWGREAR